MYVNPVTEELHNVEFYDLYGFILAYFLKQDLAVDAELCSSHRLTQLLRRQQAAAV